MLRDIRFFVASLVRKSFRIDIVEILSDLKEASPFLRDNSNDIFMLKAVS